MADTERTLSTLLSLLADNSSGDISAQDMRDVLVSLVAPRGSYHIANGNSAETSISGSGTWTKLAGTTTTGPNETIRDFEHVASNRLKYTGVIERDVRITASLTCQAAGASKDFEFSLAKNGSIIPTAQQDQFFVTASQKENVCLTAIVNLEEDDYIEVFAQNQTDATNITATRLVVVATGFLD